jgi:hypothetical protein
MRKFAIWTAGTKKTNKQTRSATVRQAGTASNNGVESTIDTKDIAGEPPKKGKIIPLQKLMKIKMSVKVCWHLVQILPLGFILNA